MNIKPYIRKTHYYETDQMGIIHHSNYIRWFEEARIDFLDQIGFSYHQAVALGLDFAVLDVSCHYQSMVRFGETVKIICSLTAVESMKMTIEYQILDQDSEKLRTSGTTTLCYFSQSRNRPVPLQRENLELYNLLVSCLE